MTPPASPSCRREYQSDRHARAVAALSDAEEAFGRELVPGSRYVDPDYRERQRVNALEYRAKRISLTPAPFRVGGFCVYRGSTDRLAVYEIRDGVAVIGYGGRTWPEAVARLRGVRE